MGVRVRRLTGLTMALALTVNAGCYSFVPAPVGTTPNAGSQVQVRLTSDGTTQLAQFLGPRVEYATGTLSEVRSDGALVVGVSSVRLLDGIDQRWNGQSAIVIPSQYVVSVAHHTLDKGRTRVAIVATVGALIGAAALAFGLTSARGDGGPDGSAPPP